MKLIDKSSNASPGTGTPPAAGPAMILARTQLGENAGAVARAMYNFELFDLRIVAPRFGWPNAKAVAAASGAAGILNAMRITPTMTDAIADCHYVFATTARAREMAKPVLTPREAMVEARRLIDAGRQVGFVFGPERTGLENDEMVLADAIVSIPVNPQFWSLNLAQAVLLCAYEWRLASIESGAVAGPDLRGDELIEPAPKADLARLLDDLVERLDQVGFFRSPDRRENLTQTIGEMFERRKLSAPEVHLLRGVFKELHTRGKRPPRPD